MCHIFTTLVVILFGIRAHVHVIQEIGANESVRERGDKRKRLVLHEQCLEKVEIVVTKHKFNLAFWGWYY